MTAKQRSGEMVINTWWFDFRLGSLHLCGGGQQTVCRVVEGDGVFSRPVLVYEDSGAGEVCEKPASTFYAKA